MECPLKNEKDGVEHLQWGVLFTHKKTLIEDMNCQKICDILDNCGHIKHLDKIEIRRKARAEEVIKKRQLEKLKAKR